MSGLSGNITIGFSVLAAILDWSCSSRNSPVKMSMPRPSTLQKSSWRHITPLGKPVVPPV